MTTPNTVAFDNWIRKDFKQINTALEELYFCQELREDIEGVGDNFKQQLLQEGNIYIAALHKEGNTDQGFDSGFDLLGNVGFYLAACRRHLLTEPSRETKSPLIEASALAMQLGASLGVVPRFTSAHLETHNRAIDGEYKTFTSLSDEKIFINYNTRSVFAFIRASEALLRIIPLGISHPVTYDLLKAAQAALKDVLLNNEKLFDELDRDRFFYGVRPYYKPHRVGLHEYRGANAGDFAGINIIDLLLGMCSSDDAYYSQLLVDKFLFIRPSDQLILRDCMRRRSLLDNFLGVLDGDQRLEGCMLENAIAYVETCELHGQTAIQHHDLLIKKFIDQPARSAGLQDQKGLTASGPPLTVLLKTLKRLCDMRSAADTDQYATRYKDLQRLRQRIELSK